MLCSHQRVVKCCKSGYMDQGLGYQQLDFLRDDFIKKKNAKKDDIVQKGGRGLGQNHHF